MSDLQDQAVFCEALRPRLLGSMVLFCGDQLLAEELTQEALARALERWDRVGRMEFPQAWAYRTGFNLARSWFRRQGVERRVRQRVGVNSPPPSLPDTATALAVRQAVMALPPRQRAAVVARFYGGLSIQESAEALQCAPGTVKALVHKAVANLRRAGLGDEEEVAVDEAH